MNKGLHPAIQSFHDAFYEKESNSYKFGVFKNFPTACCEYSSILLALFLKKHWDSSQQIGIVYGVNPDDAYDRHSWLHISLLNIDITAKQFSSQIPSVLVTIDNTDRSWHQKYNITKEVEFTLDFNSNYQEQGKKQIMEDYYSLEKIALSKYHQIMQNIKDSHSKEREVILGR